MKTIIIFIFLSLTFNLSTIAQWQADIRLTNDGAQSYFSGNRKHCIASSGSILHVVWHDQRSNWDIYYKRSSDAGISWGADTRLTNGSGESQEASVAVSGSLVHVVYQDTRDGHWEIYYIRSTDGGLSWGAETRITAVDTYDSGNPVISISGSVLHVAWDEARDGNVEIYYKRSTDNGLSWGTDTRLTNNPASSNFCSLASYSSFVHVVWYDNRDGNLEVYYKRSTDGGLSWGADTRLSDLSFNSDTPFIEVTGSIVLVTWMDSRDGNSEIYYKRSSDAGVSWSADTRLTNNSAESAGPNLTTSGSNIHLTWQDSRDGNIEIYYKRSSDAGISWGSDSRLTNNSGTSVRSFSTVTGTAVHVVWMDPSPGNWEIYYKMDPTGNPIPTPSPPVLVSPLNNIVGLPLTDTLVWNTVSSATSYRLQVATDAGFSTLIVNDSTLTTTSRIITGLSPLTIYYWRVNAKNSNGTSGWSTVWNFKTMGTATVPVLVYPTNNAVFQPTSLYCMWRKASDQTSLLSIINYWFELKTDTNQAPIVRDTILVDTLKLLTGLSNNTSYWWRVRAKNQLGYGNFSSYFKFTTILAAPSPPVLIYPTNNSTGIIPTTKLDWNVSATATSYRVQVSSDTGFSVLKLDSTITTDSIFVPAGRLLNNTKYYWHVRASNIGGNSSYSATFNFTTSLVGILSNSELPKAHKLHQSFPNPFNPVTKIKFDLPKSGNVNLIIYDVLGKEVITLYNNILKPGFYEVEFNGNDFPSGVYFYRIAIHSDKLLNDEFIDTKRMVLIK
jgi:hypothetical protein